MVDDDGSGTTGTVLNNAWLQTIYGQIDGLAGATWINEPFNPAHFSASGGMVWTVGAPAVVQSRYLIIGNVMFWSVYLTWWDGVNNKLSGTPDTTLFLTIPGGRSTFATHMFPMAQVYGVAGVPIIAGVKVGTDPPTKVGISKPTGNFALSDIPGGMFSIAIEVA